MPSVAGMLCRGVTVGFPMVLVGCGPENVCASCADPAVHVLVPDAELGQIAGVFASDVACAGAPVTCVAMADGGACAHYRIVPVTKGNCHVDVDLLAGTRFSADVQITQRTGCCAGLYADPPAAATIEVP
jgi:hypothetical protein